MGVNLVIFDGETKIDLTQDTVTAASLKKGRTAHNAAGDIITGTLEEGAMGVDKKNNTAGGQTVTISGRETEGVDTSDATAVASEIIKDKTAYVDGEKLTGTMANIGAQVSAISAVGDAIAISQGYHDGSGKVSISTTEQAKVIASNIKSGVEILGVAGTLEEKIDTSDATAASTDILTGKTAYVNDTKVTGAMTNVGAQAITINSKAAVTSIKSGYHNGSGTAQIDKTEQAKIIASNIRNGITILGVKGSLEEKIDTSDATADATSILSGKTAYVNDTKVTGTCTYDADTSSATATAADILSTKTAFVGGSKMTGTMTNVGTQTITISSLSDAIGITAGYHNGKGSAQISSTEQEKIIASNIRSGVTVLGVKGSLEEKIDTTATATAADILNGKTAYVNDTEITGTCTYDANTSDATASALNILSGKTAYVKGSKVTGTCAYDAYTSDATAVSSNLLSGKTAYVSGSKITGTMTNNGTQTSTISTVSGSASIAAGYHDGNGKVQISSTEQSKIIASNIKKGVTILGVAGSVQEGVDTSDATASATNIESGKTAYVNGSKITGTLSFRNLYTSTSEPSSSDGTTGDIWVVTAS